MTDDRGEWGKTASQKNRTPNPATRFLLIIAGTLLTGLGILGIFLPLLPTTPFLLLAAACYANSSPLFYRWLLDNRWFGEYIRNYREGKGIPLRVKVSSICLLWLTIIASVVFAYPNLLIMSILVFIATGVTIHILAIGTRKR